MPRERNDRLAALLNEAGWSRAQAANAFNQVARQNDHLGYGSVGRSHISMWISGVQPSGSAPIIMSEALSRQLHRLVTADELGFAVPHQTAPWELEWRVDPLTALNELGRSDLDPERRRLLKTAVYSAGSFVLPDETWWQAMADKPPTPIKRRHVSHTDVSAVRDLTAEFSRMDQRRGGGHGRTALAQYLHCDVAAYLQATFPDDRLRREMLSAAGELAYLSGWMAFDNGEHALAQKYFVLALKFAATAEDPPLAGHIMRAMAHQAIDLGFARRGLDLAAASMHGQRYASATPKERALLGVVHARALAATGEKQAAAKALIKAENDLAKANPQIAEPQRTFFFGEAALAHETACTLRDCGDHHGAIAQFQRSVRTRRAPFRRTHAVTLGYLGATQMTQGHVEEACATWTTALDTIEDGIYSGRAHQTIIDMRRLISSYRRRKIPSIAELDARAATYLNQID